MAGLSLPTRWGNVFFILSAHSAFNWLLTEAVVGAVATDDLPMPCTCVGWLNAFAASSGFTAGVLPLSCQTSARLMNCSSNCVVVYAKREESKGACILSSVNKRQFVKYIAGVEGGLCGHVVFTTLSSHNCLPHSPIHGT